VRTLRRVTRINEFITEVDSTQQILVSDTGNDQTLLTSAWKVIKRTGREVMMTGAFAGRNVGEVFPFVSAVAKMICGDGKAYAAYTHEALLDSNPNQRESCYLYTSRYVISGMVSTTELVASAALMEIVDSKWLDSENQRSLSTLTEPSAISKSIGSRKQRSVLYHGSQSLMALWHMNRWPDFILGVVLWQPWIRMDGRGAWDLLPTMWLTRHCRRPPNLCQRLGSMWYT
jgi:hypothetical protein